MKPAKSSSSKRMEGPNPFDHRDYKVYLLALIATYPNQGRGVRKGLAEALRCQVAYVSHVLAGAYHFSPEQAEAAARFFGLSPEESEYLVLLVAFNRAGTHELRAFYERILGTRVAEHQSLKTRVKIKETLDREDQAIYYSHWYYGAIHMLLTIPEFRTRDGVSRRLGLSARRTAEVLDFLVSRGLARKDGGTYLPTNAVIHLEGDSPLIARHHSNWRMTAAASLGDEKPSDLHYSGVVTCSVEDLPRVRERIARCLEECMEIIKPSKEERLAGLCLDWFEL
jgi:uncharacterized protein (TIGR02147 family)